MTTVLKSFPTSKTTVNIGPTQWLPGSLSASLPFYAMNPKRFPGRLFFRADDPNIYAVIASTDNIPIIQKNNIIKPFNKGFNFYSAPWVISNFNSRDMGRMHDINEIDSSIYEYITKLYSLISPATPINLINWSLESGGSVRLYQILQGNNITNINNTIYVGGSSLPNSKIAGVSDLTLITSPLISNDFAYNGTGINTYQMPYNTFYAIEKPIVISAIDGNNPQNGRIYFTLSNSSTVSNLNANI